MKSLLKSHYATINYTLAVLIAGSLATVPAMADPPNWAGSDKVEKYEKPGRHDRDERVERRYEQRSEQRSEQRGEHLDDNEHGRREDGLRGDGRREHFESRQHAMVRDYYGTPRRGRCPPGLAKKHDGCMPPGLARQWNYGQPLPRNVVYYQVPQPLVMQIGLPPPGYRYVRVAGDILMLAIGTGLVVDAIQDLGLR
jgi:Ni/Co efflux regulator RcnB